MFELKQFLDERSMLLQSNFPVDCVGNDSVYQEVVNSLLANDRISAETRACLRMETPEEYEEVKEQLLEAFDSKAAELSELEDRLFEEDFEALKDELARTGFFASAQEADNSNSAQQFLQTSSSESGDDERPSDTESSKIDFNSFFPYIEITSVLYADDDSDSDSEPLLRYF